MKYPLKVHLEMDLLNSLEDGNTLNHYSVVGTKGTYRAHGKEVCSAGIRSKVTVGTPEYVVMKTIHRYGDSATKFNKEYLNWLLTSSPLSHIYLTESVEELEELGSVVIDCNIPANLLIIAMQAFRYLWEFPFFINTWEKLVELGLDPDYAFVAVHLTSLKGELSLGANGNSNHHIFSSSMSAKTLLHFKELSLDVKERSFSVACKYEGVQHTWSSSGVSLYEALSSNVLKGKAEVNHAFGSSEVDKVDNPYEQLFKAVKSVLGEL